MSNVKPLTDEEVARLPALTTLPHGALLPFGFDRIIATIAADRTEIARLEKIEADLRTLCADKFWRNFGAGMGKVVLAILDGEGSNDG